MEQLKPIKELKTKEGNYYIFFKDGLTPALYQCEEAIEQDERFKSYYTESGIGVRFLQNTFTHYHEYTPPEPELEPFIKHEIKLYKESMEDVVVFVNGGWGKSYMENGVWMFADTHKLGLEPTHFMIIPND